MRLYRAVSEGEFRQLLRTGQFQTTPGTLEGKFFAERAADARIWGQLFGDPFRVIEVDIPDLDADEFVQFANLDGIGHARFAQLHQLSRARIIGEILL